MSAEPTVLKVVGGPRLRVFPHDHRMWAAIGIYGGQETWAVAGPDAADVSQ
jgi:predicted metal-dependent enzyme (double-stranded beta helix superfamily)